MQNGLRSHQGGSREGFSLLPLLFNISINDLIFVPLLTLKIKASGKGIKIDDDIIGILLYAGDIVLLAENEKELQDMLDSLNNWCVYMSVNATNSNIMHFRQKRFLELLLDSHMVNQTFK